MIDESGQLRALKDYRTRDWRPASLRGLAESFAWMLFGLALDVLLRAAWEEMALPVSNWGGLFPDMTGVLVAGLARGRGAACGVVMLNQLGRMAFGQVSSAFVLVEIAGGLFWGTLATQNLVVLDWRKPLLVLRTFLLAAVGGGVACAVAAWMTNLILQGQWNLMPLQQHFDEPSGGRDLLEAIPAELGVSILDMAMATLLGLPILAGLHALGRRFPVLWPAWTRTLRNYSSAVTATLLCLAAWGLSLNARMALDLSRAPLAMDFLLFKQTLVANAGYLILAVVSTASLFRWRRASLNRVNFSLSWASVALGGLLFFLSGLYLSAHALSWSIYRAVWTVERQLFAVLDNDASTQIPKDMVLVFLREADPAALSGLAFTPAWKGAGPVAWDGIQQASDRLFRPQAASGPSMVEGYLETPRGLQLAVLRREGPGGRGPALLYEEAPWVFSHGLRGQMAPTLLAFVVLFLLMALLMALLARQMMRSTSEAVLSRQARALAQKIRARNKRFEVLQVQLEEAVTQREARIRELANLAEVGKAVGILAHEIRNPIGTIQMAFGNLLEAMGTAPKGELAEQVLIIERQLRHMNTLTQSVLAFSRGAAEARERGRCSAFSVLSNCEALFAPAAARFRVDFSVQTPAEDLLVLARENEVIQILQNLILNAFESFSARDATSADRRVALSVSMEGDSACFLVTDTGPGLRAEEAERVFDLFYSRKSEGTGLGLFVARELARMLRGDLSVESEEGHGCRFLLRLPAAY